MPESCGIHTLIASAALFVEDKVALVKYRDPEQWDGEQGWFLPNDGLNFLEHPQAGATRILRNQLGFGTSKRPKLAHFESFKGNRGSWHLSWHYRFDSPSPPKVKPGEVVAEVRWFSMRELPPMPAVAHHGWALQILRAMDRSP
jgi:ADP-ribose pyrophosphatase YjhB (NUDIX family)